MLLTPTKFIMVASGAEGETELNAFDHALMRAGVGNLNLLRVSSIVPPGARRVFRLEQPRGALLPTAYTHVVSALPGERLAAAAGLGRAADGFGVIMEHAGKISEEEARATVENQVREAFAQRGLEPVGDIEVVSAEHTVRRVGCAFAAVALWDD